MAAAADIPYTSGVDCAGATSSPDEQITVANNSALSCSSAYKQVVPSHHCSCQASVTAMQQSQVHVSQGTAAAATATITLPAACTVAPNAMAAQQQTPPGGCISKHSTRHRLLRRCSTWLTFLYGGCLIEHCLRLYHQILLLLLPC